MRKKRKPRSDKRGTRPSLYELMKKAETVKPVNPATKEQ